MGRTYAGILGPVAFATVAARGLMDGAAAESTLRAACLCLFAFAALGYVAGQIAESIVSDSVRARFDAERKAGEEEKQTRGKQMQTPTSA